jgi:hypothetical protein
MIKPTADIAQLLYEREYLEIWLLSHESKPELHMEKLRVENRLAEIKFLLEKAGAGIFNG